MQTPEEFARLIADECVEGMVRQNEDGRTYYVSADNVQVVDRPTTTWMDLRGSMPEITEGLSVSDYLEVIRGED